MRKAVCVLLSTPRREHHRHCVFAVVEKLTFISMTQSLPFDIPVGM